MRLLIVDDHPQLRGGIRLLLAERPDWLVCGEAGDGLEAVEMARQLRPDVILMDLSMPRMGGAEATRIIHNELPEARVILVSQNDPAIVSRQAAELGASAFVSKCSLASDLLPTILKTLQPPDIPLRAEPPAALDITDRKTTQLQAERANALLAAIVDSSDDAIVSKNLDGIITSWNPGAERIFGYTAAEAIGKHITLIIPDDRQNEETKILARLRRGERVDHFETVRKAKDGSLLDISVTISPIRDSSGRVIGASKVARDITGHKRAQEAIRVHRERTEFAAQASNLGFWFCDLPFDKLIWDHRVKEHFWLPPDAEVTIDTFYDRLHPDDRERTHQAVEFSIAKDASYDIEYRTISPDGQHKWIRAIGRTFYDLRRNPVRFDGLTMDITDRKRAQERERQMTAEAMAANAKFRAVFEQTTVFAGIMTKDGILIDANNACLDACGYRSQEVLGRPFWDTVWWRNFPESREKIRSATPLVAEGIPYREMLRYSWSDGTERLVDFALYPIVDDNGDVIFLHPTGVDITDMKRTEENYRNLAHSLDAEVRARTQELEERNAEVLRQSELLREFSQRLMHAQDEERRHIARELHDSAGQTLTVLAMNLAQLVHDSRKLNPDAYALANETEQLVQQLIREIRTTSYLLHPPLLDETGLGPALRWYIDGLRGRSNLDITLNMDDQFERLPQDLELLVFRLVQESLTNIHRHSGSKTATIAISSDANFIALSIEDQGKGMSPEKLVEIQSRGSGVGIRGMRERVRQFQGDITIHSDTTGTRILVTIPVPQSQGDPHNSPLRATV